MPVELNIQSPVLLEAMSRLLERLPEVAGESLPDVATTLRNLAKGGSPVASGDFKGSWSDVQATEGGALSFENPTEYGPYLEYGLYPGVGPRTIEQGGQIYSRQAPGGILGPMMEDQTVLDDAINSLVNEIIRRMEATGIR